MQGRAEHLVQLAATFSGKTLSGLAHPSFGPFSENAETLSLLQLQILHSGKAQAGSVEESLQAYCNPEELHGRQADQGEVICLWQQT